MANHLLAIHPQHRVVALLALAVVLPLSTPLMVLIIQLLLLVLCLRVATLNDWWRTVLRLKWLMISLLILYGWFTPGLPLWEISGVNMPTRAGLLQAAYRAMLLSTLVAAVMWLIKPLSANVLAISLSRLLGLLRWLGINTDSLVRRLALSIHTVAGLQVQLQGRDKTSWLETTGGVLMDAEQGILPAEVEPAVNDEILATPNTRQYGLFILLMSFIVCSYGLSHFVLQRSL